jgi:hypothetical protein
MIKLMTDDVVGALGEFQATLVADPKNGLALFGRGLIKKRLGDAVGDDMDTATARRADPQVSADFWDARIIPIPRGRALRRTVTSLVSAPMPTSAPDAVDGSPPPRER